MLPVLALLCLRLALAAPGLDTTTFNEGILDYYPPRHPEVSAEVHELWTERLRQTYALIRRDAAPNIGDYWNLALGFQRLRAGQDLVGLAFRCGSRSDPAGWAEYMDRLPHAFEEWIPAVWAEWEAERQSLPLAGLHPEPVAGGEYDSGLQALLHRMNEADKRYRGQRGFLEDPEAQAAQRQLDLANQARLDSLMAERAYIGRSQVGPGLEHVAWAVIQHSDPATMERYLPRVAQAVTQGELEEGLLRMLIDRWLSLKEGCQVFGSQQGVPLAAPERRRALRARYGLEDGGH